VVGFVETHGRAETAALIEGLECLPRRKITYQAHTLEEVDTETIIARRPSVVVVDEVAHTNAPDLRNRKRYQDILDIVDAGIDVICAFNVQHLENLKGVVERATGVVIRETIPDSFLRQADQVVNLDLAAEDLLERLRAGKIYRAEHVEHALAHGFRKESLAALRELALREVAESLGRTGRTPTADGDSARAGGAGRVMVCISSLSPRAITLLRRGSRVAGRLNTDWIVAYVETPEEAPDVITTEVSRHLLANIELARELGAVVVRLQSTDPAAALLDYARGHHVGHIIVGRSQRPWWKRITRRSLVPSMMKKVGEFDLHIVGTDDVEDRR